IARLRLRRDQAGAGLVDVFLARPGLQFQQRFAPLGGFGQARAQARIAAGALEREQRRALPYPLPLADVDADAAFALRRGHGDAVVLQRAQRLRRTVAAAGQGEQGRQDQRRGAVRREDGKTHSESSSPRSTRASAWVRMWLMSSASPSKSWRQIGSP